MDNYQSMFKEKSEQTKAIMLCIIGFVNLQCHAPEEPKEEEAKLRAF